MNVCMCVCTYFNPFLLQLITSYEQDRNLVEVEGMPHLVVCFLPLPKKYLDSLVYAVIPSGSIVSFKCNFLSRTFQIILKYS
jgi:hypothetical protein